jgi:hypothetical protein
MKKHNSKKLKRLLKKHPDWMPKKVTHESMLEDGYVESFRIKSSHPYVKDEIWYRRPVGVCLR